jgi:hypothetical protein
VSSRTPSRRNSAFACVISASRPIRAGGWRGQALSRAGRGLLGARRELALRARRGLECRSLLPRQPQGIGQQANRIRPRRLAVPPLQRADPERAYLRPFGELLLRQPARTPMPP